MMNKVLIAGANGFIGSYLYNKLNKKFPITVMDNSESSIEKDFIQLDFTDSDKVKCFAENYTQFDALIFLVGLAHKKGKGKELSEFRDVNTQTLIHLLSALNKQGKLPNKIIFSSTISVYGEKYHQNIYSEDSMKKPFSPYAVTKLEAEQYLLDHFADKSWILRFAPVYAPNFLLNINRRTKIRGWSYKVRKGSAKLSLCNIKNIGIAVEGIINGKVPAGIYNISDTKEYSFDDLLKWENVNWVMPIPVFLIKSWYYLGKVTNNIFLKENSVKLMSDNIFPSDKIRQYISLPATLDDWQPSPKNAVIASED